MSVNRIFNRKERRKASSRLKDFCRVHQVAYKGKDCPVCSWQGYAEFLYNAIQLQNGVIDKQPNRVARCA